MWWKVLTDFDKNSISEETVQTFSFFPIRVGRKLPFPSCYITTKQQWPIGNKEQPQKVTKSLDKLVGFTGQFGTSIKNTVEWYQSKEEIRSQWLTFFGLFCRVHATLQPTLSVRWSVRRSVRPSVHRSVRPSHFNFLLYYKLYLTILSHSKSFSF